MDGWILLDEVIEIKKGAMAKAITRVPEAPYGLEVLMTEMTAQLGGLFVGAENDYQKDIVLTKIEEVVIHAIPKVNSEITIDVFADGELNEHGGWVVGKVFDDDKVFAETKIMLTIVGVLEPEADGLVTFPESHLKKHRIREKIIH